MYQEEKVIDGVLHYRNSPDEDFKPYTAEQLTGKYKYLESKFMQKPDESDLQWANRIIGDKPLLVRD